MGEFSMGKYYLFKFIGMIYLYIFMESSFALNFIARYSEQQKTESLQLSLFLWAVVIIGGCIIMTLIYVGYRKYKGEKERKHQKENKE